MYPAATLFPHQFCAVKYDHKDADFRKRLMNEGDNHAGGGISWGIKEAVKKRFANLYPEHKNPQDQQYNKWNTFENNTDLKFRLK